MENALSDPLPPFMTSEQSNMALDEVPINTGEVFPSGQRKKISPNEADEIRASLAIPLGPSRKYPWGKEIGSMFD